MKLTFGIAAAIVVGLLAWLLWPGSGSPTVLTADTAQHSVQLSVDDPKQGANSIGLHITDHTGRPVTVDSVVVEPVMPQMGHALTPVTAGAEAPGSYRAPDTELPMPGQWEITVSLRAAGDTEQVVFPLLVK
ncbi:FixH family protein [Actinocrispum wychmicini]|uniref:YtkA-like protein n=1 Tax=Actinocrispum wychmicini TaxID=1213861 RepID=A0A4R2IVD1_9PSEU|nr:FixH family protein [Actinocrispum wychmicini]TCO48148.1 YtkA-like protein [Actinocrispum wychmicini]